MNTDHRILFPTGVALTDTPLGHLEFAIRHEGIDLATIAAALPQIGRDAIVVRLHENPNGEYIRRIAFLWEWLTGAPLDAGVKPTAHYVDLLDPRWYVVAGHPVRDRNWRINNDALGDPRFCPVVRRDACPEPGWLEAMLTRAVDLAETTRAANHYQRTLQYLYLSETRGGFAIEREAPSASKEERFVQILRHATDIPRLTEDVLVEIQNAIVRNDFAKEASYRTRQNWLENATGRITFLPFMDGNGRLHRYVIHHVLNRSGRIPPDLVIPVSAVIMKHIPRYHQVLTDFSESLTRLWDYRRFDEGPDIKRHPGAGPYRYFTADSEVEFLRDMIQQTVEQEIPQELAWLQGYDQAFRGIDTEFDIPANQISRLIRMISGNSGALAKGKRSQFGWLPDDAIARIEQIVCVSCCERSRSMHWRHRS